MRPDLPWTVAGIPPEAREAARAAARREGLSVGEWLTRRILRGLADDGFEGELSDDSWSESDMFRAEPQAQTPPDAETDRPRSESPIAAIYRRIEDQLRGVARRMDAAERSQSENNRVMSRAATEMNIATREQTQAFDQLGAHVVTLADRIERVERANSANGMKEAVKQLHAGLSRLAEQMSQSAGESAARFGSLSTNLDSLSSRLAQSKADAETATQSLERRIAALDDRIYAVEKASQTTVAALERTLDGMQQSRARRDLENDRRESTTASAIARLEEKLGRLEARSADPDIERRLGGIERSLGDLVRRFDGGDSVSAKSADDALRKLAARLDTSESRQLDSISALRASLNEIVGRLDAFDSRTHAPATPAIESFVAPEHPTVADAFTPPPSSAPPPPAFDIAGFPDVPTPGAPPLFQAQAEPPLPPFAAAPSDEPAAGVFETHLGPVETAGFAEPEVSPGEASALFDAGGDSFLPPHPFDEGHSPLDEPPPGAPAGEAAPEAPDDLTAAGQDSFLHAARRSALAAANAAEAEQSSRGFAWGVGRGEREPEGERSRVVLVAFIALIAIALVAGIVLSQGLVGSTGRSTGLSALFANRARNSAALAPSSAPKKGSVATAAGRSAARKPVSNPAARAARSAAPLAPMAALDRLTALANSGDPKAELIVGLKYLNGQSTPASDAEAAKWLEKAAASGEPVAQYRLGTLYERGKGVAADSGQAAHWYEAAALQGNRKAMHNLAVALAEGTGVKKDLAEAARWFSKAAALGLADSQFNLAVLYERGQGVPQSLLDAYKWYAIAAAGGDAESKLRIEALSTQLSADDRAAAQHAADSFKARPIDPRANIAPTQDKLSGG
ncbi:MAG TPA: hypothetical protein VHC42_08490 [Rhizomicrobium sp.]|nr:hypothetical protein [Rhizomicrobium sp.]